jgi:hypothetical protein
MSEKDSNLSQDHSDGGQRHPDSGQIYHRARGLESFHLYTCLLYCHDRQNKEWYETRVRNYGIRYTFVRLEHLPDPQA